MQRFKHLLFLALLLPHLAIGAWEDFHGCYKTLKYNGVNIPDDPLNNGSIKLSEGSLMALDLEKEEIPTHAILLYRGKVDGVANLAYQDVFVHKGTTHDQDDYLIHHFEGQVRFKFEPEIILDYKVQTKIKLLTPNTLELKYTSLIQSPNFSQDESGTFILKKLECHHE